MGSSRVSVAYSWASEPRDANPEPLSGYLEVVCESLGVASEWDRLAMALSRPESELEVPRTYCYRAALHKAAGSEGAMRTDLARAFDLGVVDAYQFNLDLAG